MRDKNKKSKHVSLVPYPTPLQLAIDELVNYTEAHDAEFMHDSTFGYCIGSKQFAELDDMARMDHFTFYTLVKSLLSAVYRKPFGKKPNRKEKNN
jgi:hypothetical protein